MNWLGQTAEASRRDGVFARTVDFFRPFFERGTAYWDSETESLQSINQSEPIIQEFYSKMRFLMSIYIKS